MIVELYNNPDKKIDIEVVMEISKIIGRYIKLNKSDDKKFHSDCPFCGKKGDFIVSDEKGLFYCFNCKEGGNAYTFLIKHKGVKFQEANRIIKGILNEYNSC